MKSSSTIFSLLLAGTLGLLLTPGCFLVRDSVDCTDQICIISRQGVDYVLGTEYDDIYVQNPFPFDVTVTLELMPQNMGVHLYQPLTETYKGQSITKVARATVTNPKQPWSVHHAYTWSIGSIHAVHDTNYLYRLPYQAGMAYPVSQGYNGAYSHSGQNQFAVDFRLPEGTLVCAARPGMVVEVKEDSDQGGAGQEYQSFANYVRVLQDDGTIADYSHLRQFGATVTVGEHVSRGDTIGFSGNTGWSSGPHLHFRVMQTIDGSSRQSCRLKFATASGTINDPIEGMAYIAK